MKTSKILTYVAAMYLGGSLHAFASIKVTNWEWWVISIPIILLYTIAVNMAEDEN